MGNNPVNANDPTGHLATCNWNDPGPQCYRQGDGGGGGGGSGGGGGGGGDDSKAKNPLDTALNSYKQGWEYFGDAVSNCHIGVSGVIPCAYADAWAGAHVVIIAGAIYITWEAIIASGAACGSNPECEQEASSEVQDTVERGVTVIGKYPANKELAQSIGGSFLNIPTEQWNAMTPDERWSINVQFLQDAIIRGDIFRLASSPAEATSTSYFLRELLWLAEAGYTTISNGQYMFHP